jgi:hypothetical protein
MGQTPRVLTPYQSAQHFFGAELRRWRTLRGLSQDALGRLVLHSGDMIGKVEKAVRSPSLELATRCDTVLRTEGALTGLWNLVLQGQPGPEVTPAVTAGASPEQALSDNDGGTCDPDPTDGSVHRRSLWPLAVAAFAEAAVPTLGLALLHPAAGATSAEADQIAQRLRAQLVTRRLNRIEPTMNLNAIEAGAVAAHAAYQRADYTASARTLVDVLAGAAGWAHQVDGPDQARAQRALAVGNVAASKLAGKLGDHGLAWVCADRAATAAELADDKALGAVAAYQIGCALLRMRRLADAESVLVSAADELNEPREPKLCSAGGALLLLAAVVAARAGNPADAYKRLAAANLFADALGTDRNHLWTGFGPTNVRIHEVTVAVELCRPDHAIGIGERLDTSALPGSLVSRRAQVHLDLAAAYCQRPDGDPSAVQHLVEAERIAPQVIQVNQAARSLVAGLMSRERRSTSPGLRSLARRAGVLV